MMNKIKNWLYAAAGAAAAVLVLLLRRHTAHSAPAGGTVYEEHSDSGSLRRSVSAAAADTGSADNAATDAAAVAAADSIRRISYGRDGFRRELLSYFSRESGTAVQPNRAGTAKHGGICGCGRSGTGSTADETNNGE